MKLHPRHACAEISRTDLEPPLHHGCETHAWADRRAVTSRIRMLRPTRVLGMGDFGFTPAIAIIIIQLGRVRLRCSCGCWRRFGRLCLY